jgi:hypothetical protein
MSWYPDKWRTIRWKKKRVFLNVWYQDLQRQEIISYPEWTVFFMDFPRSMMISMKNWKRL